MPTPGHDARRANRARALADLDGVGAAVGEELHRGGAGHVAGDDGQLGKRVAQHPHRIAHAPAVAVRGRDRHHVQAALDQPADVGEDALAVQLPERVARRRHRRAAESRKCASRAGLNCAFRSCVMRSTSLIVNSPCSRSWSSTTSSLWMPGWSVKNLSALAMGSRPSSFLLMRLDLARAA